MIHFATLRSFDSPFIRVPKYILFGLEADTKPPIPVESWGEQWLFFETDTTKFFRAVGGVWDEVTAVVSATWGGLIGDIEDQTDLMALLASMSATIPSMKELIVNVPIGALEYSAIVVDADVSATSHIDVGWGNLLQADVNHPSMDDVWFNAIPDDGQFTIELIGRLGGILLGDYKLNYLTTN